MKKALIINSIYSNSAEIKIRLKICNVNMYKDIKLKQFTKELLDKLNGKKPKVFATKENRLLTSEKYIKSSTPKNADFILVNQKLIEPTDYIYYQSNNAQNVYELDNKQFKELLGLLSSAPIRNDNITYLTDETKIDNKTYDVKCKISDIIKIIDDEDIDIFLSPSERRDLEGIQKQYNKDVFKYNEDGEHKYEYILNYQELDYDAFSEKLYNITSFFNVIQENDTVINEDMYLQLNTMLNSSDSYNDYVYVFHILNSCNIEKSLSYICLLLDEHYESFYNKFRGTDYSSKFKGFSLKICDKDHVYRNTIIRHICEKFNYSMPKDILEKYATKIMKNYFNSIYRDIEIRFEENDKNYCVEFLKSNNRSIR